jgi:hypothetical protein
MLRKILFGVLLFNSGIAVSQLNPGHFDIRLVDLAGNQFGVEMRNTNAASTPHGNGTCTLLAENTLFNDLIFTLKCTDCSVSGDINDVFVDNCTSTEMEEFGYGVEDQTIGAPIFGYYLHPFALDNNPFDCPEDWVLGEWVQIVVLNHAADIDPVGVSIVTYEEALVDPGFGINREPNISLIENGTMETAYTPEVEGVLPLDLIGFTAQIYEERSAILKWSTVNEVNTSHFVIERSLDRVNWTEVGKVQASGESQAIVNYQLVDVDVYDGRKPNARFYYRLQMVDRDARSSKSNIEIVQFSSDVVVATVFVFPNPSTNGVNVELNYNEETAQPADIVLYNDLGQMVYQQEIAEGSALEYIDFTKSNITSGTYTLQVMDQTNGILTTEKLVVQR